jgi:hypothetical protein
MISGTGKLGRQLVQAIIVVHRQYTKTPRGQCLFLFLHFYQITLMLCRHRSRFRKKSLCMQDSTMRTPQAIFFSTLLPALAVSGSSARVSMELLTAPAAAGDGVVYPYGGDVG